MHLSRLALIGAALALVAAACGDDGDTEPSAPTTAAVTQDVPSPATTNTPPPATTGPVTTEPTGTPPAPAPDELPPGSVAAGWSVTEIGDGTKPVLALDSAGSPAIAFLTERLGNGFVAYASAADGWVVDKFVEGYFYGPIGLDFDEADTPHVVWHDHQADTFEQDLGSLVLAVRRDGEWVTVEGTDDGHDGWDSTVAIGSDGVVRAAGIDPAQFGRQDGVEYYELSGDTFSVEAIGTGPIAYEFNVALAVDDRGTPALTYYDTSADSLRFARRSDAGWEIATVDEGAAGKYSSLVLDADGLAHITYFHQTGPSTGTVRYAVEDTSGNWAIEDIATLDEVRTGFTGARRITSIALDPEGRPHAAFSDEGAIYMGSRQTDGWDVAPVIAAGSRPLGQLVSFAIDASGGRHLTYFEVTATSPLSGVVFYAQS